MGRAEDLKQAASYVARKENRRKSEELTILLWTLATSLLFGCGIMLFIIRS